MYVNFWLRVPLCGLCFVFGGASFVPDVRQCETVAARITVLPDFLIDEMHVLHAVIPILLESAYQMKLF